ncbi:MAG: class I SAM-dependent methyltransferase [bacterium]
MKSVSIANVTVRNTGRQTWLDRFARKMIFSHLGKLKRGHLIVSEDGQTWRFGEDIEAASITAHIHVHDQSFYRDMLFNSSIGAGEAYMRGAWSSPDLVAVVRLMVKNLRLLNEIDRRRPVLSRIKATIGYLAQRNTRLGSKKNIAAHYDLSNQFFAQFLDPTMMYSSAVYPENGATLEQASIHKVDQLCRKLRLKPSDHLVEIGTGWGGLAIHAALKYGCRVTTTTISREQHDYAADRIKELGLDDRITLLLKDYRDLEGQFDKLVSVEMIEAVGHQYYESYFQQCSRLLKPDGLMVIQAITIADQRYLDARNSVDFIKQYIFPGGCLPSNEIIARHIARDTDMQIVGLEDITPHYAQTLFHWREAFFARLKSVESLGFDKVFQRMWDFYFCYCEGGFRERAIGTVQLEIAKPDFRFDNQ